MTDTKHTRYSPDICPLIVKWMVEGLTPIQVAARLQISYNLFKQWIYSKEHPELNEAVDIAVTACEAYWTKRGQDAIVGKIKDFRESTYKSYMQHNFNWADKTEQKVETAEKHLTDEELEVKIKSYLAIHNINGKSNGQGSSS